MSDPIATPAVIQATALRKAYGDVHALDGLDLSVPRGRIVGLIGPNGSGKTTALKAILGLAHLDGGDLQVLGRDPADSRAALMRHVAYIADTGILPRWMKVRDLLAHVERVHPGFDRAVAEAQLATTEVRLDKKVGVLSKGMHVQLHLAIVLAIGAELLVLDEPTLGLDIIYRQQFYDAVLNDYFTQDRSILVTTHEVREIEHILTDVVFIDHGRAVLSLAMEQVEAEFVKVLSAGEISAPVAPLSRKQTLSGVEYIFRGVDRQILAASGEVSTPNLAELFVAVVQGPKGEAS